MTKHQYDLYFDFAMEVLDDLRRTNRLDDPEADPIENALRLLVNCLDDYVENYGALRDECEEIDEEEDDED